MSVHVKSQVLVVVVNNQVGVIMAYSYFICKEKDMVIVANVLEVVPNNIP